MLPKKTKLWPKDRDVAVTPTGIVYSKKNRWDHLKEWRLLTRHLNTSGYLCVSISGHGLIPVHRIVAETYLKNVSGGGEVNHIDGNKSNNDVSNLEWVTRSRNLKHAYETGLRTGPSKQKILVVETGDVYDSQLACARSLGLHQGDISNALKGKVSHVRGYTFERVTDD